ncbi:MAG: hypothetical protein ABIS39_00560 [Sphingomicrobium sp.]
MAVAAAILLAFVPLLYPTVPPLVDLLGHMGRYRVELDLDRSAHLQQYYAFQWAPIGNLGVDLLVYPLARLIGLEPAVKLVLLAIPPLTVAGFLWVAREVHHRVPPTAYFALPFVFGYPFLFGFANFALAMALAFLAFGWWLRLARFGHFWLRTALFVPISFVLYFCHTYGWGMLGLLCFSAEAVRQHDAGRSWWRAGLAAIPHAAVMAGPLLFILAWRSDIGQDMTRGWFNWSDKWLWVESALRDRWKPLDIGMLLVAAGVLVSAIFSKRLQFSRNLAFSAIVLTVAFVLLPWKIFGSAYADMRLVPYVMAVTLLAIRVGPKARLVHAWGIAVFAFAFWVVKVAATSASLAIAANQQEAQMQALQHVPMGARLVTLVGQDCRSFWPLFRNSHMPSMALARRHAFANDQWAIEGANLLIVDYPAAGYFESDPSQMVRPRTCRWSSRNSIDWALGAFSRDAFDFVWLVDPPAFDPASVADLRLVWSGEGSRLYRVAREGEEVPK